MPTVVMTITAGLLPPGAAKHVVALVEAMVPDAYTRQHGHNTQVCIPAEEEATTAWGAPDGQEPTLPCSIRGCRHLCRGDSGFGVHIARRHGLKGRRVGMQDLRAHLLQLAYRGEQTDLPPLPTLRPREGRPRGVSTPPPEAIPDAPTPDPVDVPDAPKPDPQEGEFGAAHLLPTTSSQGGELAPAVLEAVALDGAARPDPVVVGVGRADVHLEAEGLTGAGSPVVEAEPPVEEEPVVEAEALVVDPAARPWVSTPIERRPFDPEAVREQSLRASFLTL